MMPVMENNQQPDVTLALAWGHIQTMPDEAMLTALLPASLRATLSNASVYSAERDQCRLLAYFLLAKLLQTFDLPLTLMNGVERTDTGRPYFNGAPRLDFNISHSGQWAAVALIMSTLKSAVAVDIEVPKPRDFSKLLTHIGDKQEYAWWRAQRDPCQAFYQAWCLREAVLKSQGFGIAKLRSVRHLPSTQEIITPFAPIGQVRFYAHLPFYLALFNQGTIQPIHAFEWREHKLNVRTLKSAVCYQVKPHFMR
ncbi:4'-phosphopantetheinyl transferase family protein [Spirabiliibacterium falconis]|uniref:4'-phosphopantetheinyl transferase family protein n=1 Tax=Spirabiliibacterium falconis TaxID=572023 RepID=UPI001AACBB58|nr:4'-phosphopantetheinyl transferase superfamily protein [Spirabiliibacterium falconis]MBE2893592.1 4'-phosphopantetheinyl transferase superfamily protein [Spirabiliibacterium falconis]